MDLTTLRAPLSVAHEAMQPAKQRCLLVRGCWKQLHLESFLDKVALASNA
ncbi:HTH-type transcriptional regulator IscR [Sesbania bispinosa]|nr:HTH-type transcriptional regulator IscR [Sesbania bispinosa]